MTDCGAPEDGGRMSTPADAEPQDRPTEDTEVSDSQQSSEPEESSEPDVEWTDENTEAGDVDEPQGPLARSEESLGEARDAAKKALVDQDPELDFPDAEDDG